MPVSPKTNFGQEADSLNETHGVPQAASFKLSINNQIPTRAFQKAARIEGPSSREALLGPIGHADT